MLGRNKDNSRRRFSGGGPRPDGSVVKRRQAEERQEAWAKLSLEDQIELLDKRLGVGIGATKQRAKIMTKIKELKA
jgi:hypothetical protein